MNKLPTSELTSVHVPYRNTRIFWYRYTNYRFTRFTQNTRFTREYEAIASAFEMSIKITRRSLAGLQKISERDEMILTFWRKATGTRDQTSSS